MNAARYLLKLFIAAAIGAAAAVLLAGCQSGGGEFILRGETSGAIDAAPGASSPAWKVSAEWKIASR